MTTSCSEPLCTSPATRQADADDYDATNPWSADNFVAFCAAHAHGRDTWPLVESEGGAR